MLIPDRRPLLIRLYNDSLSKTTLSFDRLLKKARKNTGLRSLGQDFNDEALQVLIKSINEEARLHPFGSFMIKKKLLGQLESRLWAEYWFSKYPEIVQQPLLPVLLITGLQRTGTTKLQRLLSQQKDARQLFSWEALYPAPLKEKSECQKRIRQTRINERAVKWISPTFHSIHPIYHNQPEEDVLLLDLHFMSSSSEAIMHVPGYAEWLGRQDHSESYKYEVKLLKLLQWQRGGSFWVLKSPHHLEYLDICQSEMEDPQIIWTHRKVIETIPSFLNMLYHSRRMFSDSVDPRDITNHWLPKIQRMLSKGVEFRNQQEGNIVDVKYGSLVKNELEVLQNIASKTGLFEINDSIPSFESTYQSRHYYDVKDWGLSSAKIEELFMEYSNTEILHE